MVVKGKRLIIGGVLAVLFLVPALAGRAYYSEPGAKPASAEQQTSSCQQLLAQALQAIQTSCDGLGRNRACYGNNSVKAEPNGKITLKFDSRGDQASIRDIKTLSTSALDPAKKTWGLSLLKLQANLPDTLPGQNVTFLVFGDATIENVSGDMRSFYFTTGLGNLACREAPRDGILVRSPQHTEVTFDANGVQITIASTIVLRATAHQSMEVYLEEGQARVSTAAGTQVLQPGEVSSIALGGVNGLTAISSPSAPRQANEPGSLSSVVAVASKEGDAASVNITLAASAISRAMSLSSMTSA